LIDGVVGWIEVLVGMGIRRESRLNPQYSTCFVADAVVTGWPNPIETSMVSTRTICLLPIQGV
jgi:hypothetical protein